MDSIGKSKTHSVADVVTTLSERMKTLAIALLALVGCTTQEWKCPNAPKLVAKFAVGERVAFTQAIYVRVSEYQFDVEVGDTGIVTDIEYINDDMWGQMIRYCVLLDKGADKHWEAHTFQTQTEDHVWDGWLEAVIYPDPALAPRK